MLENKDVDDEMRNMPTSRNGKREAKLPPQQKLLGEGDNDRVEE